MSAQLTPEQSFPPEWLETEPPKDGTPICAIGQLIYTDDCLTTSESFFANVVWVRDVSGFEGWHFYSNGMCVAQTLEDKIRINYWFKIPFIEEGGAA